MSGNPFPDEIMCKVLDDIPSKQDLINICLGSPQCERICGPTKPLWLMELVFPSLLKFLSKEDILNMRTICRDWLQAVDARLERHPNLEAYDPNNPNLSGLSASNMAIWEKNGLLDEIRFTTYAQVNMFMETFNLPPPRHSRYNVIPSRSVSFEPEWNGIVTLDQFWTFVIALLQVCGKDIWFVEFHIDPRFQTSPRSLYDKLREALLLLPNLRSLEVVARLHADQSEYSLEEETKHYEANPLPVLDRLEFLLIRTVLRLVVNTEDDWTPYIDMAPSVDHALLKAYSQKVKRLSMQLFLEGSLPLWNDVCPASLDNLTEVNLNVPASDISGLLTPKRLTSLSKLTLGKMVTLDQVFRMIHDIRGLEVLEIRDISCITLGAADLPRMTFPSVKALRLDYHQHLDYGFLRNFENLEYLEVDWSQCCTKRIPLDFVNNLLPAANLYASRIWFVLPRLRQVLFKKMQSGRLPKKTTYTRERFDYINGL